MRRGGRVGFVGTIEAALLHFDVDSLASLYAHLAEASQTSYAVRPTQRRISAIPAVDERSRPTRMAYPMRVLTRRTLETFVRNPLTLAILLGSPVLVVGMFAVLFRPGAFDLAAPSPSSMVMIGFWVVFAAFFLRADVRPIADLHGTNDRAPRATRRLRLGSYVASKVTVLVPFLSVVILSMLGVLRLLNRLPSRPLSTYASMTMTLLLCAIAR